MSIIKSGLKDNVPLFILDELKFFEDSGQLRLKEELYAVWTPFRTDSEVEALKRRYENPTMSYRNRKRKRPTSGVGRKQELVNKICGLLKEIKELGGEYFAKVPATEIFANNSKARNSAKNCLVSTSEASNTGIYHNNSAEVEKIEINDSVYLLPKKSSFLIGDVKDSALLLPATFDFIVMDPPWNNKSVKRLKTYDWFEEKDLLDIRMDELLSAEGLVAVWVTNNYTRYHDYLLDAVFPKWNVKLLATWHWLKVTKAGEAVYGFERPDHKLPFESILLAGRTNSSSIPKEVIFASVPSAIHSRKPPIIDLVSHFTKRPEQVLELYGRYLLPNTTTIGYEALKLQHSNLFKTQ